MTPQPYVAWHRDMDVRMDSTSGGVFSALAEAVLGQQGVVVGAVIDGLNIRHIAIETIEDMPQLRRSKYQQSNASGIYRNVLSLLQGGRTVLFTGTPCQVGAMIHFLEKRTYKGTLYTMDLFCHGVPTSLAVQRFAKKTKLQKILSWRDKENGWGIDSSHFRYLDKEGELSDLHSGEFVIQAFHSWLTLRASCKSCTFAQFKRKADFTVADYWGERAHPQEHRAGVSLLIAHTPHGKAFIETSCPSLHAERVLWRDTCVATNRKLHDGSEALHRHWLRKIMPIAFHFFPLSLLARLYRPHPANKSYQRFERENYQHGVMSMQNAFFKDVPTINLMSHQYTLNYGGVLNVYALKELLEEWGHNCRVLDAPVKKNDELYFTRNGGSYDIMREKYDAFKTKHLRYCYDLKQILSVQRFSENDAFIVGSDQIWNPKYTEERLEDYLLKFAPQKSLKASYAASLGSATLSADECALMRPLVKRFDFISCREPDGVETCKSQLGVDATWCIDQTLLLPAEKYQRLFQDLNRNEERSTSELVAFLFGKQDIERKDSLCKTLASRANLRVRVFNRKEEDKDFLYSHYASIEEWLYRIANAKFVVTNSFHGMCFSIIFQRDFMVLPRDPSATLSANECTRMTSLLSALGLKDRFVTTYEAAEAFAMTPIDWEEVEAKLEPLRAYAMSYLQNVLSAWEAKRGK